VLKHTNWAICCVLLAGLSGVALQLGKRGEVLWLELRADRLPPGADGNPILLPPVSTAALDAFGRPVGRPGTTAALFLVREASVPSDLQFWDAVAPWNRTRQ